MQYLLDESMIKMHRPVLEHSYLCFHQLVHKTRDELSIVYAFRCSPKSFANVISAGECCGPKLTDLTQSSVIQTRKKIIIEYHVLLIYSEIFTT